MEKPMVSVIVPVYNVETYLPQCLESLLGQTLSEIEILCVDDASTDSSAEVVLVFAEKDSRVRLLRQEHSGVSAARNLGLAQARGEYIAFVDADDWIESAMLEVMVTKAREGNWDVAVCAAQVHYEDDSRREPLERALTTEAGVWQKNGEDSLWQCLDRNGSWPFVWNKLYRRELLKAHDIRFSSRLTLGEDGAFLVMLWQCVEKVGFLKEKLYHYRYQRKASATVRLYQNEVRRFCQHIDVADVLLEEFSRREIKSGKAPQLLRWILNFLYYDFVRLPASQRREISEKLKAVLDGHGMLPVFREMDPLGRRRLKNLTETEKKCTSLKRTWDIWQLRIENRLFR